MGNNLITIATAANLFDANIIKGRLESSGISCYVPQFDMCVPTFTIVPIRVNENDIAKAIWLLHESGTETIFDQDGGLDYRCSECGMRVGEEAEGCPGCAADLSEVEEETT